MVDASSREPARDPQELERLLVTRQRAGNLEGMMVLYEAGAVVDCGGGKLLHGKDAIRAYFADAIASGRKFVIGEQREALVSGDLALTSTRLPDGTATSEVARRQPDGTWLWAIDRFKVE
jgi:ketosteroid isomerase-like protein